MSKRLPAWLIVTISLMALITPALAQNQPSGDFEIFSWWTGDESAALETMIAKYNGLYPDVNIINTAVTQGSGGNMLKTRMLDGDAPDTFQVHAGQDLIGTWVAADQMQDLTFLFQSEGWMDKFPPALIDLLSYNGGIWSVPVSVYRSNVLWFVPARLQEWGVQVPATWDDFLYVCRTLQAADVTPLAVGENQTVSLLWENVAISELGAEHWKALWAGTKNWTDADVVAMWDKFGKILDCTNINEDAATLSWQQATDKVIDGTAAFNVMGDWAMGYMVTTKKLEPGTAFGWAPAPGTTGIFNLVSDSFVVPKGARNVDAADAWLKLVGSKEGQDIFNPLMGSIAARLDSDLALYNAYSQSAAADWQSNVIVGSMVYGTVAPESFTSEFSTIMQNFLSSHDSQAAADATQALAVQTGIIKQ